MSFRNFIISILILLFIWGCQKENTIPDDTGEKEENPEVPIDSLICDCPEIDDNNLVAGVFEQDSSLYLVLESHDTISLSQRCVNEYSIDSINWNLNLSFTDSTAFDLPFLGNHFTIDPYSIILNPSGQAPLSAIVYFSTPFPRKVRIVIEPKSELSARISTELDAFEKYHAIPVFGLYSNYTNKVTIELLNQFDEAAVLTKTIEIVTEPISRVQSGEMTVITNNFNDEQKDRLFLIQNAIYDGAGDVRWYTTHSGKKFYALSDGLIGIQTFPDKGWIEEGPDIKIINYLGELIDTFDVPHRMHHEINEKYPGGNLLVATNAEEYYTTADDTEDMVIEIDRNTGEVVKEWDLRKIFDPARKRLWTENVNDWCHLNSIQYDSTDNTLLISSKLQYFVSKIDYDTGEILWICGNHENWKEPWQPFLLEPLNFETDQYPDQGWTYAQHMPRLTDEGFIVYDNGNSRPGDDYTRAVEFRIDTANMTVEKIWSYDFSNAARTMGSVYVYDDNTVQIGHAEKGEILEVTQDNTVLFHGRVMTYYRAYPIQLYK